MKESALSSDDRAELDGLLERGFEILGELVDFPEDPDDAAAVMSAIGSAVDALRAGKSPPHLHDPEQIAFALGALWGDVAQSAIGWEWVMLEGDNGELLALVSPDRAYALRPQLFLYRLLMQPKSDNTAVLLFNMLKAGKLPPSAPKRYLIIE